jgi:hypothetical protein
MHRWYSLLIESILLLVSLLLSIVALFCCARHDAYLCPILAGGTYMTLLNTAANLGGTWPASFVMYLTGRLTKPASNCSFDETTGTELCRIPARDGYLPLQMGLSILGLAWVLLLSGRVRHVAALPDDAWRTHLLDEETSDSDALLSDMESGEAAQTNGLLWNTSTNRKDESKVA